jgi:hypothetical protein
MAVQITIDKRRFVVSFDVDGKPLSIRERKKYGIPPYDGWCNVSYWHAKHHSIGGPKFLASRIIEAAKAKYAAS